MSLLVYFVVQVASVGPELCFHDYLITFISSLPPPLPYWETHHQSGLSTVFYKSPIQSPLYPRRTWTGGEKALITSNIS